MALVTIFFVTLPNGDLNVYSYIPYKPLQDSDYRQKNKILQNNILMLK